MPKILRAIPPRPSSPPKKMRLAAKNSDNVGMSVFRKFFFNAAAFLAQALLLSCATMQQAPSTDAGEAAGDSVVESEEDNARIEWARKVEGVSLRVVSRPRETVKGKKFSAPFVVAAEREDGSAVEGLSITVSYPFARDNDDVMFKTKEIVTGNDGTASFMPDEPVRSFDSEATFYPTPFDSSPAAAREAGAASVSAPFAARSDKTGDGGIIYVWDCDEQGRPASNSRYLLAELINSGVKAGNAPFPTSRQLSLSDEEIWREARKYVQQGFFVEGTVKHEKPVSKDDGGKIVCCLRAEVRCIDLRDGKILYETARSESATGASKDSAIDACRKALAKRTARAILHGM